MSNQHLIEELQFFVARAEYDMRTSPYLLRSDELELVRQAIAALQIRDSHLQRLDLQPHDKIVVRTAMRISQENAQRIKEHLTEAFPHHQILVISEGMALGAINDGKGNTTVDAGFVTPADALRHGSTD